MKKIVWFISAHGFGHAARSTAIMEALYERHKDIEFLIVSEIPEWFFEQNDLPLTFFKTKTDVGLIQKDAFFEDIPATLEHLNAFYFNVHSRFHYWDETILAFKPDFIVSDICPAALHYADSRHIPSVLIENFTWNWLYEFYADYFDDFAPINDYLESCWKKAHLHFRMEPVCGETKSPAQLINPVSRKPRWLINHKDEEISKIQLQKELQLDASKKTILLTMGGVPMQFNFYDELKKYSHIQFIIPGAHERIYFEDNIRVLTHHSSFYHPDLVAISDAVIAKVGYSTIAEVHNAQKRLGFVPRDHFRETEPLVSFVKRQMSGLTIHHKDLSSGKWLTQLDELLHMPIHFQTKENGADQIANTLINDFIN
ncbi:hypothetical protein EP331_06525 [bacterium]|nr:MAG: hypothetical protein EP331_06525 [bacterium]